MQAQRKGATGERELAKLLTLAVEGVDAKRGGASFGTVPDITGLPYIHIEAKRVEKLNLHKAMEQSIRDAEEFQDGFPTVFHRRNREPWLVTMRFVDWLEMYKIFLTEKRMFSLDGLDLGSLEGV